MIDKNFFHLHRKAGHRILLLLGTVAFVLFVLAVMAIHGAAHLFNKAMEEQTLLRGTIEVETISADIMGNVHLRPYSGMTLKATSSCTSLMAV